MSETNRDASRRAVRRAACGQRADAPETAPVFHQEASWSPDGKQIAFVSDRDGRAQLYVREEDGSGAMRIGRSEGEEHNPRWSPDGEWITFFSTMDKVDHVETIHPDGTQRRAVALGVFPDWSPAGDRLLYTREHALYTAAPDGGDERLLAEDGFAGRWSPDGKTIAFIRGRWPASEAWLIDADGTGARRLTR